MTTVSNWIICATLTVLCWAVFLPQQAQAVELVSKHGQWEVSRHSKLNYFLATQDKNDPDNYLTIVLRHSCEVDHLGGVFSNLLLDAEQQKTYQATPFQYRVDSKETMVGSPMITSTKSTDMGWIQRAAIAPTDWFLGDMFKGRWLRVRSIEASDSVSVGRFSLIGFTAAYKAGYALCQADDIDPTEEDKKFFANPEQEAKDEKFFNGSAKGDGAGNTAKWIGS